MKKAKPQPANSPAAIRGDALAEKMMAQAEQARALLAAYEADPGDPETAEQLKAADKELARLNREMEALLRELNWLPAKEKRPKKTGK